MQGKCADCRTFRKWLHKHHLKPQAKGGTDADGVVYLCANCHEDRHGGPCGGIGRGRSAHSPQAQKKRGKSMKQLWADPEYRERQRQSRIDAWKNRDRAKQAKVMQKIWTPEKRKKHSTLLKKLQTGRKGDIRLPQNKERLARDLKTLWSETQ